MFCLVADESRKENEIQAVDVRIRVLCLFVGGKCMEFKFSSLDRPF